DHCFNCQMCRIECPAKVDVPYLAYRCKAAYVAAHGISVTDNFFARIDMVLKFASVFGYPLNWLLARRWFRWLLDKSIGIPAGRKLPKFGRIPYLTRAAWTKRLSNTSRRGERKVALFIDSYVNYFDSKLAENAVKVLEHNGINVHVPIHQLGSGLSAIASGHGEYAEYIARKNSAIFADLVRQGYKVVAIEPAAALCFRHEYKFLSQDPDTQLVADNTVDLCTFLFDLHKNGKLKLDFQPVHATVGYHAPCRSIALGNQSLNNSLPAEELLGLVPGLEVTRLERGCCGQAGSFGLKKSNYQLSLRLGIRLFLGLRNPLIQAGTTDCTACRLQMEQGCAKPTIHPIKILAYSYGLTSDFASALDAKQRE
ncbi:MAG: heterodisulfide reductase-related iron-sulfur binding cluster, partial [Thermoguttaceae bacterium]